MASDQPLYNWKRLFYPVDKKLNLPSDFLPDPDAEYGHYYNPELVASDALFEAPCVVILGEQGIGKSTVFREEEHAAANTVCLPIDTGRIVSDIMLKERIFENPLFRGWVSGDHVLQLFLDSLDEGPLDVHSKANILETELCRYSVDRLRLRIACRIADWPKSLNDVLKAAWGDGYQVYGLAPLRQKDVEEAARMNEIDPEAFLREIDDKNVRVLASKPLSLTMLLKQYKKDKSFSSSQVELMHDGLLRLCEEITDARRAHEQMSSDQRLIMAGRIAAITMFGAKSAIWLGSNSVHCPDNGCVMVEDICGDTESVDDSSFDVKSKAVRDTLNTGLFRRYGRDSVYWGHQTYAEYLAAWYMVHRKVPVEQIKSLLLHPKGSLIPKLRGVAAWFTELDHEHFELLLKADPEALLLVGLTNVSDPDKSALTHALLDLYNRRGAFPRDTYSYKELDHDGLSNIIREYLGSEATFEGAKYLALEIAADCCLNALADDLLDIVFDSTKPPRLRARAADAIRVSCPREVRNKLAPFVANNIENDPDDEIIGTCLAAIWPDCVSTEELLAVLAPPKNTHLTGAYQVFLHFNFLKGIEPSDLPKVLEWARSLPSRDKAYWSDRIRDILIEQAWNNLETPGVSKSLALTLVSEVNRYQNVDVPEDDSKRQQILPDVIAAAIEEGVEPTGPRYHGPLIKPQDLPLLISYLESEGNEAVQTFLAKLIVHTANLATPEGLDAILEARRANGILDREYAWPPLSVELDSDLARQMQNAYEAEVEASKVYAREERKGPSPSRRLKRSLRDGKNGKMAAWWQITWVLGLNEDGSSSRDRDLTELPGWRNADEQTRCNITALAEMYIARTDPNADNWFPTTWILNYRPAYAGYRALHLLFKERLEHLLQLPDELWHRWAPVIVAGVELDNTDVAKLLLVSAYRRVPDEVRSALAMLAATHYSTVARSTEVVWDDVVAHALTEKCMEEDLPLDCLKKLLAVLLGHNHPAAKQFAESLIDISDPGKREKAVAAAQSLMLYSSDAGWSVVWPAIQKDEEFGKLVVNGLVMTRHWGNEVATAQMTPDNYADLYIWIERCYPNEHNIALYGSVGPVEARYMWKGSVSSYLAGIGAVEAVLKIKDALPELDWMENVLTEARKANLERTWMPPTPGKLLQIVGNSRVRLVQTEEQLLNVVIESIARLEQRLHGETPQLFCVWDDLGNGKCKPKEENRLSDYVADHLRSDLEKSGIILNREVEIRPRYGSRAGEQTDILVRTSASDGPADHRVVSVVIEVKGNWHQELYTAMESQLVNRYLKENKCQCGLYLVGWFSSADWNGCNASRAQIKSMEEARTFLENQASDLSGDKRRIRAYVLDASR